MRQYYAHQNNYLLTLLARQALAVLENLFPFFNGLVLRELKEEDELWI